MTTTDATRPSQPALPELDATDLGALVAAGDLDPIEVLERTITAFRRLDPQLNVLDSDRFEAALDGAALNGIGLDPSAPFAGVPMLVKDLIEYPDLPFRSGSRLFADNVSDWRSDYVDALESSGLVVLGKSTTPEFGLSATTEPVLNGPTRNPWNLDLSPGGSSGGSAAAVAARLVPVAHANDAGGSIRIPASLCGVFGLKPSRGRVGQARQNGLAADIAVEHALTRSVRDSARLLSVTERTDRDAPNQPVGFVSEPAGRRLRIGLILDDIHGNRPDREVTDAIEATATLCETLGHHVEPAVWPLGGDELIDHFVVIWSAGAAFVADLFRQQTGAAPDDTVLEPFTLGLAESFGRRDPADLPAARRYVDEVSADSSAWFSDVDLLLSPVTARSRLAIGELGPDREFESLLDAIIEFASYTPLHNLAGLPAMSVPLGMTPDQLPVGSQFSAGTGNERLLFELAYELEEATPWQNRRPGVAATMA